MVELDPQVKDFLAESAENLDQLDRDFVALEQEPQNRTRLGSVFRTIHTIKGTCGFFGFGKLESIAHVGENLLSRLRDGELLLTSESTTALLALVDAIRGIFANISETATEGAGDYSALVATLTRLTEQAPAPGAAPPAPAPASAPAPAPPAAPPAPAEHHAHAAAHAPKPTPEEQAVAYLKTSAGATHADTALSQSMAAAGLSVAASGVRESQADGPDGNVRVGVALLDRLMTLVGELVLARNQILQHAAVRKEPTLARTTQRLNLITTELQEGVMKTRMQPISTVWSRLPRVVRDLAALCGKQVKLEMEGAGHGARPHRHRGHQGSAHARRPQLGGSRDRDAGPAVRRGQGRGGAAGAPRVPRGRAGEHRHHRRRRRDQPRAGQGEGARAAG